MPHVPFKAEGRLLPPRTAFMLRRNRAERERDKSFAGLIASPHDFGTLAADSTSVTNLALPARARLALALDAALDAEDIVVNIAGATLGFTHPALLADEIHRGSVGEETMVVSITRTAGAPAGAFTFYLVDAQGLHKAIGTATFSA